MSGPVPNRDGKPDPNAGRPREYDPEHWAKIERARQEGRRRAQARRPEQESADWSDFSDLAYGEAQRAVPELCCRTDGQPLFYRGKENNIYGPTEAGKDMIIVRSVIEGLEHGWPMVEIDFEEGDGIDTGSRLLEAGLDAEILTHRFLWRHATPATAREADAFLDEVTRRRPHPAFVIFNGITAAYGMYGWPIKENDSATAFRAHLIKPCLAAGIGTISTDHVTKESANARDGKLSRYAMGGVMKLNLVSGAAYLVDPSAPIERGGVGYSRLLLTKDRPGSVKPACLRTKDPTIKLAGMLEVKSSVGPGKMGWDLNINISAPCEEDAVSSKSVSTDIPGWLMEKVSLEFEDALPGSRSRTSVRDQWQGEGKKQVFAAVEILENRGYLEQAEKSTSGYRHRSVRPWREGVDDKMHPNSTGTVPE